MERAKSTPELAPWDAHISLVEVHGDSAGAGASLLELRLRERFGVNIAMIERGSRILVSPSRTEHIFPGDILSVIGTDEQLDRFRRFLEPVEMPDRLPKSKQRQDVALRRLAIQNGSELLHKTIRESGLRERTKGIIVGIERDGKRMLNPDSTVRFEFGDIVWIVGNIRRLQVLLNDERADPV